MNIFQSTYSHRLKDWHDLRTKAKNLSVIDACVLIDYWWQHAPIIPHHLHPQDQNNWPDPWTMLSENNYCLLTRALGICYTLLLIDIDDLKLMKATDSDGDEHNLVIVDRAKYVLNYYPNSVLSTNLNDFRVSQVIDIETLKKHIK